MINSYKLSKTAAQHLQAIVDYTDAQFGAQQTDIYMMGLKQTFEMLTHFNEAGVMQPEIKASWRRFRYQQHHIYYSIQSDYILIEAIVHTSRQLRKDLFDD